MTFPNCRHRGFTALELLTVLAIAAVITVLAVPGFGFVRRSASLTTAANQLLWALHFARSSAILRSQPTVVCLSADGARCLAGAGAVGSGWLVFQDLERSTPTQLGGADVLLHETRFPADVQARGSRSAVTYWPTVRGGTTSTFLLCDAHGGAAGREVVVSQTGRPRVAGVASCAS